MSGTPSPGAPLKWTLLVTPSRGTIVQVRTSVGEEWELADGGSGMWSDMKEGGVVCGKCVGAVGVGRS